ncbi:DUF4144 family protein [Vibrio sp. E150_011]
MIQWPCLLKLEGDDELIYLASEPHFFMESRDLIWSDDDVVVDSVGACFTLCASSSDSSPDSVALQKCNQTVSLEEVTQLIQAHEFCLAEMCLTKIQFPSIFAAITSLSFER